MASPRCAKSYFARVSQALTPTPTNTSLPSGSDAILQAAQSACARNIDKYNPDLSDLAASLSDAIDGSVVRSQSVDIKTILLDCKTTCCDAVMDGGYAAE